MAILRVGIRTPNGTILYGNDTYEQMVADAVEQKVLPNPATVSDQVRYIQNANKKLFKAGDSLRFVWRLEYAS